MSSLQSTTSALAIIEAWNRRQQEAYLELSLIYWVDYYIPANLIVVRPLRQDECDGVDFDGEPNRVWYAGFSARSGELRVVSDNLHSLRREIKEAGYLITCLQ